MHRTRIYASVLRSVLEKTPQSKQRGVAARFVELLKRGGQLKAAGNILQEFKKLWAERRGKQARVLTALPLLKTQRDHIRRALQKKGFVMKEEVNPQLVGGTAIFLGNEYVIDNTVKGKLQKLKRYLNG
ncbi:MAG: F0F1 ATP synthase subunit delta [Candidatus Wildermuthbacteria bacterium]|nr:F0F1 ATP synthase subunit delta [Candidatus Wildermuthbacteria bacterium]